jgi:hypothetical protein
MFLQRYGIISKHQNSNIQKTFEYLKNININLGVRYFPHTHASDECVSVAIL